MMKANVYQYDLFVSYATPNRPIAEYVVERIEKRGKKCFIAPRDIRLGFDYATEIVNGISNSCAVLLVFSSQSDKSAYVLREVNSAVSRNKTIIPLRIENFVPSEAMEFYLGPTHWLDAFPHILDTHLDNILAILNGLEISEAAVQNKSNENISAEWQVMDMTQALVEKFDKKKVALREIELDYLCISPDKFEMNDNTEGTLEDWIDSISELEDASCLLLRGDEIMGYCDVYPVSNANFDVLISGEQMISADKCDVYAFGGEFDAYIAMMAIDPVCATQERYLQLLAWVFSKLKKWGEEDINIDRIGISVYSSMTEKFVKALGFEFAAINPAKGKVYKTNYALLKNNAVYKKITAKSDK